MTEHLALVYLLEDMEHLQLLQNCAKKYTSAVRELIEVQVRKYKKHIRGDLRRLAPEDYTAALDLLTETFGSYAEFIV